MQALPRLALLLATISASSTVYTWGAEDHRLIGELAEPQLTPTAQADAGQLLAAEPGATLSCVATWADGVRSEATASWHYLNPPQGICSSDRARDCDDGQCAVEALTTQIVVLKSTAPTEQLPIALKWVVHLVGDVH